MSRILIVEDNRTLAKFLAKKMTKNLQFDIDVAYTLENVKQFISKNEYFIVLTDIHLSDSPGGEVVDYLVENNQKVIILTANIDNDFRQKMIAKNIIDYVKKSGIDDIDYIISMIKRLSKNREHTILVVDDSSTMRNHYKKMLENLFFHVISKENGVKALELLNQENKISLLITDYNMPVMDGLELTIELRKNYNKSELPIITVSSNEDDEVIAMFLKHGANDYIKKPFSKEEFYCRVDNTIDTYENIQTIVNSANRDYLTGLYNRRYFFQNIDSLLKNAKESGEQLYLAIADIDDFKSINDTYGHDVGDKAIVLVSSLLLSSIRSKDMVARIGGEEFCIAVIAKDDEIAQSIYQEMIKDIRESKLQVGSKDINVTVSIGVTKHLADSNINDTMLEADKNLYEAKKNGKNRIVFKEIIEA